jgi:hypothetical protein
MESGYFLVLTLYFVSINIAVLIFTQMMINIIRFHTSIGSIDPKLTKLMLIFSLSAIDKNSLTTTTQIVKYR